MGPAPDDETVSAEAEGSETDDSEVRPAAQLVLLLSQLVRCPGRKMRRVRFREGVPVEVYDGVGGG